MPTQKLKNKLNSVHKLNAMDWEMMQEKFESFRISKNTFLTKKGNKEKYLYFINKGIIRGYIDTEDRQITLGFAYENDFTSAIDSFVSGENTEINVYTESELEGFRISRKDLLALYDKNQNIERLGRLLMETLLLLMSKQQIYYLTMSAEERYLRFMKQSSHLLQMVAQKHIASYLGMSAETFSRLRKKFS